MGKSRLAEEFLDRAGVPSVYDAATGRPAHDELRTFSEEVASSTLPAADLPRGVELASWDAALRLLASAVGDGPCGPVETGVQREPAPPLRPPPDQC